MLIFGIENKNGGEFPVAVRVLEVKGPFGKDFAFFFGVVAVELFFR